MPQLVDRCRRRFGSRVVEYHSGCRDSEKVRWLAPLSGSGSTPRRGGDPFCHLHATSPPRARGPR
jgi:hypothetical protein